MSQIYANHTYRFVISWTEYDGDGPKPKDVMGTYCVALYNGAVTGDDATPIDFRCLDDRDDQATDLALFEAIADICQDNDVPVRCTEIPITWDT